MTVFERGAPNPRADIRRAIAAGLTWEEYSADFTPFVRILWRRMWQDEGGPFASDSHNPADVIPLPGGE